MPVKLLNMKNQTLVTIQADVCNGDGVSLVTIETTNYDLLVAQLTILYDIFDQRYELEKLSHTNIHENFYANFTTYINKYVEPINEDILLTIHEALTEFIPATSVGFRATRIHEIIMVHDHHVSKITKPNDYERLELLQELIKYGKSLI